MGIVVIGQVCTSKGLVEWRHADGGPRPATTPAAGYRSDQPAVIPVHFGHDTPGRSAGSSTWNAPPPPG
jgi:hypothetical protein